MSKIDKATMVVSFLNMLLSLITYMIEENILYCGFAVLWGVVFVMYVNEYRKTKSIGESKA